jgi:glutathione synthase/RimK-type ligase-like ATP-grasp enzyme
MKIAIHPFKNGFSDYWLEVLKTRKTNYKIVDCYSSDIIEQLSDCTHLIWQWTQADPKAMMMAYSLTKALEQKGVKVFPSSNNSWHFDDKVAQKYLLEAIDAPLVKSYVFYNKNKAKNWLSSCSFPKVFKLRGGASSNNVKLISNKKEGCRLIDKAFGRGFPRVNRVELFRDRIGRFKLNPSYKTLLGLAKGVARLFVQTELEKTLGRDRGYAYFQDFIPNNNSDIRIIIIGKRAFGIKRMVRKNDFRASGSGLVSYDINDIPSKCLKIAFDLSEKLNTDCLCYDFVYDNDVPLLVEISYGFAPIGYVGVKGYWDKDLTFYSEQKPIANYILKDILEFDD